MEKIAQFWLLLHLVVVAAAVTPNPLPLNCSDSNRVCTSFLAFSPSQRQTLADVQSMFDVLPADITSDDGPAPTPYLYVRKNCSCSAPTKRYLTNTTFTVREDGASVYDAVIAAYHGLAVLTNTSRPARAGAVVSLHLLCGCSSGLWNYLMSYVMQPEDSLELLASRFGVSMESIEAVNTIADPSNVTTGALYFIPLNSVPGLPHSSNQPPAPSPGVPSSSEITFPAKKGKHSSQFPYRWILGILGVGLVIIVVGVLTFILCKSRICCNNIERNGEKDGDSTISHKFHILRRPSFCSGSRRYFCCNSEKCKPATLDVPGNQVDRHIPKAIVTEVFDVERPVTFTYQEILSSTDGFSESNLLGHGTYGSVYYGILRDLEVSIKRMTATKTKEFLAEMKVLCKVHHMNLVELIGYAATDDELFLIYEYAQKGSLKNHLHDPQNKGHTPLSWIARVQIALDAARGLEYIHEHTKSHYVHRDIKTSNILLDGSLRAKISDFGLSKLVGKTNDGEVSVTRVVGTFGYLAPEYLNDGLATTKSDVYAFGVVLFELLTGKEAITRTETRTSANSERRSLASIMLAVLKNSPSSLSMGSLKESIDPNLLDLYPHDCAYKLATLAKQCVDEEPVLRPDMKEIVISLSQILLSSIEWDATLAGNSQVFSGLVQGR